MKWFHRILSKVRPSGEGKHQFNRGRRFCFRPRLEDRTLPSVSGTFTGP